MYKIIYNPLSQNGKGKKIVEKIIKELKLNENDYSLINAIEVDEPEEIIAALNEDDNAILVGGDGSLHKMANKIKDYLENGTLKTKIYLYRGGTGNDFSRDVKKEFKKNLVYLNEHLTNLPRVEFNGQKRVFVNGVGLGVDALICKKVNETQNKSKKNYFKNVIKSLKEYHKSPVTVIVDGKEYHYNKALFTTVMHGRYFGGGMKITPKQKRDNDTLSVIVINKIPTPLLACILPTVYLGWHTIFPCVHIHTGKNIEVIFDEDKYLQLDGEVEENVRSIKVYKENL